MIYTSYFAKIKTMPDNIVPVSIALKPASEFKGLQLTKLAPNWSILNNWKRNPDKDEYTRRYFKEILGNLSAKQIVSELKAMCGDKDIALICYERTSDFCHRHLVAEWLRNNGFECEEWKIEKQK